MFSPLFSCVAAYDSGTDAQIAPYEPHIGRHRVGDQVKHLRPVHVRSTCKCLCHVCPRHIYRYLAAKTAAQIRRGDLCGSVPICAHKRVWGTDLCRLLTPQALVLSRPAPIVC